MECPCGGIIQTTQELLSSEEALKKFPNQRTIIPRGYSVLSVRHGCCPLDGRLGLHVTGVKLSPEKQSIFRFVKKQETANV